MRLCARQIKLSARLFRLPRLQIAAFGLLMVVYGSTGSAQNLNDNHRAAWTAGGSINEFLRVNRKKIDTQKVRGSPWLAHGSPVHGDLFPNPTDLLLSILLLPSSPRSQPHAVPLPCTTSRRPSRPIPRVLCLPFLLGLSCGPSPTPFSVLSPFPFIRVYTPPGLQQRVYTPPGCQQPFGAGLLDPHPSRDRFVRLARVAPFPPPSLSPVPRPITLLGLFHASRVFPFSWGCFAALAHALLCPLPFPHHPVFLTLPGRQQPFGAGPLDPHPSGDCFVCLALVAPFPPPSVWVVCFRYHLPGALLPGPRFPRYPCLFPTWSPAVVVFFSRATRGPSSARLLLPVPPLPARSVRFALRWCFGVFFFCPPLSRCASCLVVPSSLHARTPALHWSSGHGSPLCSSPVPSPSLGVALGSPRPCQLETPSRLSPPFPLLTPLYSVSRPPS